MFGNGELITATRYRLAERRSNYDVTNTVDVSSAPAVRDGVLELFEDAYPHASLDTIWMAFHDFDALFEGRLPEYKGCDTVYHDKQHSLDVTLATARLIAAHEKQCGTTDRIGEDRSIMTLIVALFHDAGYIRRTDEPQHLNGAEYTIWHVSRSAEFLRQYLPQLGLGDWAGVAARIVHFTGYEINLDDIEVSNSGDRLVGHFLGTADLIAQMADRCYLEKCRDRLYAEFVLAGIAVGKGPSDQPKVLYGSGIDLLRKTPDFFSRFARVRLDRNFNGAYRIINALYDGRNPYIAFIQQNFRYLRRLIRSESWLGLRRKPPCFTVLPNPQRSVNALVGRYLARLNAPASALTTN